MTPLVAQVVVVMVTKLVAAGIAEARVVEALAVLDQLGTVPAVLLQVAAEQILGNF